MDSIGISGNPDLSVSLNGNLDVSGKPTSSESLKPPSLTGPGLVDKGLNVNPLGPVVVHKGLKGNPGGPVNIPLEEGNAVQKGMVTKVPDIRHGLGGS
jgi:hypothetical protein